MGRPTKAVELYNKALFEQGLIKCCDCKEIKPLDDFGNKSDMWHGKSTRCKPCNLIHNRKREDNKKNNKQMSNAILKNLAKAVQKSEKEKKTFFSRKGNN